MAKAGWQSTEFWLVGALFVLVVLNGPLELGLSANELISMAIAVAGYSGGRGLAKVRYTDVDTVSMQTNSPGLGRPASGVTVTRGRVSDDSGQGELRRVVPSGAPEDDPVVTRPQP